MQKTFVDILLFILDWTWCFPQTVIGRVLSRGWKNNLAPANDADLLWIKRKEKEWRCKIYLVKKESRDKHWFWQKVSGFGCGRYICLTEAEPDNGEIDDLETVMHEHGHIIFSRITGPFFMLLCGIPSPAGNLINRWQAKHKGWTWEQLVTWYYNQPWEKCADILGGVDRTKWIKERVYDPE